MATISAFQLHAAGSTGNSSSTAVENTGDSDDVCFEVNVTTAGTTCTYTFEGSMDGSTYLPVRCVPHDSETVASSVVRTTTGITTHFTQNGQFYRFFRITSSANTGQTYGTRLHLVDVD